MRRAALQPPLSATSCPIPPPPPPPFRARVGRIRSCLLVCSVGQSHPRSSAQPPSPPRLAAVDRDLAAAAQLPRLRSLHLHLSPSSPDAYEQRVLGGVVTAAGVRLLAEAVTQLQSLALVHCNLTKDALFQLGAIKKLRALNLAGAQARPPDRPTA